jgi:multidrug efflux pump
MTSMAFTLGVLPLFLASGAGSASQRAIGTGVVGGMLSGTLFAVLFVPLFFAVVRRLFPPSARQQRFARHETENQNLNAPREDR